MDFKEKIQNIKQQLSLIIDDLEKGTIENEVNNKDFLLKRSQERLNDTLSKLLIIENDIRNSIKEKEEIIRDSNHELSDIQNEIIERKEITQDKMDTIRASKPREKDAIKERRHALSDIGFHSFFILVLLYGMYKL
jgi:hypothetical protein